MAVKHPQSRSWVITLNNYSEEEWQTLITLPVISYAVFGKEGKEEGATPHIQGAVTLAKNVRLSWWKKIVPRAHIEVMKAKQKEKAFDYCKKEGDFVVIENRARAKESRKKYDALAEWTERLGEGATLAELIDADPIEAAMYHKPLEWLTLKMTAPRTEKPYVVWLYGPSGVGKSHAVMQEVGPYAYWHKCDSFKWWSLYMGQKDVVLEELRGGHASLNELLRLFDFTPLAVETKGGHIQMRATRVFVTTPYAPTDIYRNEEGSRDEAIGQLRRRIDEVYDCYIDVEGRRCRDDVTELMRCGKFYEVQKRAVVNVGELPPVSELYAGSTQW